MLHLQMSARRKAPQTNLAPALPEPARKLRADAARNRTRVLEAARELFGRGALRRTMEPRFRLSMQGPRSPEQSEWLAEAAVH
jgi:hypothetical protein